MQFYKKKSLETNNNNEYLKMTSMIKSDLINSVCFECGTKNPQYISINNAVFICKDCISNHLTFPHDISQIIINDLYSLNLSEIKMLYFGGNRKLIHFINFDFPGLKQLPPEVLYKTNAVDYYRKNLKFLVNGGKKPLRPGAQLAYKLIEFNKDNNNKYLLSPKLKKNEKNFNFTELTPILEGKDEIDEKENNEDDDTFLQINKNFEENTKNESTMVNTPQKDLERNNNNISDIIINNNNQNNNKSFLNEKNKNNNSINNIINKYTKKNIGRDYKSKIINREKEKIKDNLNTNEEIKFNTDKNISEIINNESNNNSNLQNIKTSKENNNENNNNLNDDISGDDNTIRIVNGYINISRENDFSDFKSNKENNDSFNSSIKEKTEEKIKEEIDTKNKNKKMISRNKNKVGVDNKYHNKMKAETDTIEKIRKEELDNNNNENSNIDARYNNDNKIMKSKNKDKDKYNSYNKNKKEKYISDEEGEYDNDIDINYDIIKMTNKKKNIDNIKKEKEENKSSKSILIKKQEYSSEEESEEEDEKFEKLNLTEIKPNRHLRAKITTSRIFKFNEDNGNTNKYKDFNDKNIKSKKVTNKKERKDKYLTSNKIMLKQNENDEIEKDNFFSDKNTFSSGFINPLKYLQKSFQKKQNEKFENISNSSEEEESYGEEELNNKRIKGKENKVEKTRKIIEITTQRKKYNTYANNKNNEDNFNNSNDEEVD